MRIFKTGQRVAVRYCDRMAMGKIGFASDNDRGLLLQLDPDASGQTLLLSVVAGEGQVYRSIFDDQEVWIEPIGA